ncbi:acylphosphatase [Candidatus Pacearchaeota archaeon]|nr:acylphosphatase [Candidatus Pacearchaeota archaeon]
MKTYKIHIIGTVQGISFRQFLFDKARELELKGFCRNLNGGAVEVVVEGRDENVNEMITACKQGPKHADVKEVETEELHHQGFKEFKIIKF